ncbi:MAG: hypothetical protein JKY34_01250 [Kordiimonadaceae bacterium]|nr:hypothetical protein [Kordiimonadaceae bacterium]
MTIEKLGITARQSSLLTFVASRFLDEGVSPSYREMCKAIGLKSTSGINRLVEGLIERGCIRRGSAGMARTLSITSHGWQMVAPNVPGNAQ